MLLAALFILMLSSGNDNDVLNSTKARYY